MYQVSSNSVTSKVTDQQKEQLNALLAEYQEKGHVITSFRDFISLLLEGKLTETPETIEKNELEPLQLEIAEYAENNSLSEDYSEIQIVEHALTHKPEPKVEIKTEKQEVEIERELKDNELLLVFTPEQQECFEQINANRNRELKKQGKDEESKQFTALGLMFNIATVNNYRGAFYTGI